MNSKGLVRGLEEFKIDWDYPNYSIVEISQNIEKSVRDLRRFDVTQTPVKDYQLTQERKTHKE